MVDAPRSEPSLGNLRVGIAFTTEPGVTRVLLDEFCGALADALELEVTPRGVWHYHRLLDALDLGEVDLAWLPPILALRATARGGVIPIALPVRNGSCVYSSALFTRESSPIRALSDLIGLRAAWVDRQSAAGYLIIRAHLKSQGVELDTAFTSDQFLGAHDEVARAVVEGEADVGATYAHVVHGATEDVVASGGWGDAKVRVLSHVGPIPSDVIAASVRAPAAVSRLVQEALLDESRTELQRTARALFRAQGFAAPLPEHLDPLTKLLGMMDDPGRAAHSLFPPGG